MAEGAFKHRLAALLSADVVGYSRLMAQDELATVRTLTVCREKIHALAQENGGRVVNFVGDNVLVEFPSALDALLILAGAKAASNHLQDAADVADEVRRVAPDFTLEKFAKTQPYKNSETLEQLLGTLRKTGLH